MPKITPQWQGGKEPTWNTGDVVPSLGLEDPLEESMATHSTILAWRIPVDRGAWQATVHGVTKSQTRLSDSLSIHTKEGASLVAQTVKNPPAMQGTWF